MNGALKNIVFTLMMVMLLLQAAVAQEGETQTEEPDTSGIVLVMDAIDSTKAEQPDSILAEEAHPQDSPEDRGFLIVTSDGKAQLRIRGSIRMNGAYDFNGLQSQNTFSTYDIPVGQSGDAEPRFFMSANQSRLGIEATRESGIGDVFMKIEGDFFTNNRFRLRHAFGRTERLLVGQTWSTFGDVLSIPLTVDLDGPNSSVAERTVQIRYTTSISEGMRWSLAIESPSPEISLPDSLQALEEQNFQGFPDFAGRIKKSGEWGHVQFAGILRSIAIKVPDFDTEYLTGIGALLSGRFQLNSQNEIYYQGVIGNAISRFITTLTGEGLDAIFNPQTLKLETVTSMGGFISFGHHWKPQLQSFFTAGVTNVVNKDFQPDDAFSLSQYISVNLFWNVTAGTRAGMEYSFGRRFNKDGQSGTANRFSFIVYYDF